MPVRPAFKQWLFRSAPGEPTPIVLGQRRIFIVPTRAGLLFALVLVVMLIGAINYDLSLGHALVFLLASLGMVTMVHTFRNLVALRLTPGHAEPVFAGETAYFPMQLENTHRQPRRALSLSFDRCEAVSVDLAADGQATVAIPRTTTRRGRFDPGRITLFSEYPLGLFHAWSYPYPKLSCLVYPRPIETPLPAPTPTTQSGQHYGDTGQEDFTGLRQRQPNDSPRHIAWKAVARDIDHSPLLVKQFDGGAAEELWFDLARVPIDEARDDALEGRLSILTSWVLAAENLHRVYGLRLNTLHLGPDQGRAHRDACLEVLALYGQETA